MTTEVTNTEENTEVVATPAENAPAAEELIDGKFKSQDELLAAYKSLEKKLGGAKPAEDPVEEPAVEEPVEDSEEDTAEDPYGPAVSNAMKEAGLDAEEVSKTFMETGSITEEHYVSLVSAGFSRDLVDVYLEGVRSMVADQKATVQESVSETIESIGGEDEYTKMSGWMSQNLSAEDLTKYNDAVTSGDTDYANYTVNKMYSRYTESVGSKGKLVKGTVVPGSQDEGFSTQEEVVAAMRDKRYKTDPAYVAEVTNKIARSRKFKRN